MIGNAYPVITKPQGYPHPLGHDLHSATSSRESLLTMFRIIYNKGFYIWLKTIDCMFPTGINELVETMVNALHSDVHL
jgi:hypothetical protein